MTTLALSTPMLSAPIRMIFMGTAAVACPTVQALAAWPAGRLIGVITQPERPQGRNRLVTTCPVRQRLGNASIPFWTPGNVNAPASLAQIRAAAPDAIVVMAYGQFLGRELLAIPALGCINVHLSLLPQYRGAAPIQWALANGETETGLTIMQMTRRMDAGDILAQARLPIMPADTAPRLGERLAAAAPKLLLETLARLARGERFGRPQDETAATFAPILKKSDGCIDWALPAEVIERHLRGFDPWPGVYCRSPQPAMHALRILRAAVEPVDPASDRHPGPADPGMVLAIDRDGPLISTGRDALRLLELQPAGGRPMSGSAYVCGHRLRIGERMQ